jgi:tRNA-intron endonuclease
MSDNEGRESEKIQVEGILEKDKVIINNEDAIEEFYKGSYIGTTEEREGEEILVLLDIETLLLYERNRIHVWKDNDKEKELYDFEGLLTYFTQFNKDLWQHYVIYMDLRRRGYIVRSGYGDGILFRVYKRGADFTEEGAKYLIYPVFEGSPIELRDLDKNSRVALNSRKELIIATVDRLSRPIYYNVKKFEILNRDIKGDARE